MDYLEFKKLVISEMNNRLAQYDNDELSDWIVDLVKLVESLGE